MEDVAPSLVPVIYGLLTINVIAPDAFTGSEEDGFEMIFDGDYDMIRAEIEDEGNYN